MKVSYKTMRDVSRWLLTVVLLAFSGLCVGGCRPASEPAEDPPAPAPSAVERLADRMTGKTAIDAGQRAKAEIEDIVEKQNARIEEVLAE